MDEAPREDEKLLPPSMPSRNELRKALPILPASVSKLPRSPVIRRIFDSACAVNEKNPKDAKRRAERNERFWRMVFCMNGISYTELKEMLGRLGMLYTYRIYAYVPNHSILSCNGIKCFNVSYRTETLG